jgi:hypothetical protein
MSRTPAALPVPGGRPASCRQVGEVSLVADLAHHVPVLGPHPQQTRTAAVHHAVGGQFGDGRRQVVEPGPPHEPEPLGRVGREVPDLAEHVGGGGAFD